MGSTNQRNLDKTNIRVQKTNKTLIKHISGGQKTNETLIKPISGVKKLTKP
jgi:hypothetical protein